MTLGTRLSSRCRARPARVRQQVLGRRGPWARKPRTKVPFSARCHVLARDPAP